MTIKEAQETVDQWINTTGVRYFSELTNTAILMEEVGEVARIMSRKYGEQSFKKSDEAVDLGDEMADVLLYLLRLADKLQVDVTVAAQAKLKLNAEKYPVEKSKGNAIKYSRREK